MRRIGLWVITGLLLLCLIYLLKPRSRDINPPLHVEEAAAGMATAMGAKTRLNLNTASLRELESLPGIGAVTANRIVEYREKHGPFTRPEDVIIIDGIGEKEFLALADLIRVE